MFYFIYIFMSGIWVQLCIFHESKCTFVCRRQMGKTMIFLIYIFLNTWAHYILVKFPISLYLTCVHTCNICEVWLVDYFSQGLRLHSNSFKHTFIIFLKSFILIVFCLYLWGSNICGAFYGNVWAHLVPLLFNISKEIILCYGFDFL